VIWEYYLQWPVWKLVVGDVTGDNNEEIILGGGYNGDKGITVLDKSGNVVWKYYANWYGLEWCGSIPTLGDLTGDGINDMVIFSDGMDGTPANVLYALDNNGNLLWSKFYNRVQEDMATTPVLIDVTGDGIKDVVVCAEKKIYAYKNDGTFLWTLDGGMSLENVKLYLFDIDHDSNDEIIFEKDHIIYEVSQNGGKITAIGELENDGTIRQRPYMQRPTSADVDGDGFDELIVKETIGDQYYVSVVSLNKSVGVNLILNSDFSQHQNSTDPENPYRDLFPGWEMGATVEMPGGEDGLYPRWLWGPRYPSCPYSGLLIDSPPSTVAYFQQTFSLPENIEATLQFTIRRCVAPCEIRIYLINSTGSNLVATVNSADGLGEWYANAKTYSYDISQYSGQRLTLRFEQTSSIWDWSCVLYQNVSVIVGAPPRGIYLRVLNQSGKPANDALVDVFADTSSRPLYRGSTDSNGFIWIDVPDGSYTLVVCSSKDHFVIVKTNVTSPSSVFANTFNTVQVDFYTKRTDENPMVAGIYLPPYTYSEGQLGTTDSEGHLTANVCPMNYNCVLAWSWDEKYTLSKENININSPTVIEINAAEMEIGEIEISSLPGFDEMRFCPYSSCWPWAAPVYPVNEGDTVTLSAGDYNFWTPLAKQNETGVTWEYGVETFYVPHTITNGAHEYILAGGNFNIHTSTEKTAYSLGENVKITNTFKDYFGNNITLIQAKAPGGDKWEQVYPRIVVKNSQGDVIVDEQNPSIWKGYSFSLPSDAPGGKYTVNLSIDTGPHQGVLKTSSTFEVNVNTPPNIVIGYPQSGQTISGSITILGTSSDLDGNEQIQKVQVRIDSGSWKDATGTTGWSYSWDTNTISDGYHTIYTRAWDGTDYSSVISIMVLVDNIPENQPPHPVTLYDPTDITSSSMEISWSKNIDTDFDRYELYMSTYSGFTPTSSTKVVTITQQGVTDYTTLHDLTSSTTYYFKVRVFDTGGLYSDSNQVSGATLGINRNMVLVDFTYDPPLPTEGENVYISPTISNEGSQREDYEIRFYVDGRRQASVDESLSAGGTITYHNLFTWIAEKGEHELKVRITPLEGEPFEDNYLTKIISVEENQEEIIDAQITGVEILRYEKVVGEKYLYKGKNTVTLKVWVKNTGNTEYKFWIGCSFREHDTQHIKDMEPKYIQLSPRSKGYATFSWYITEDVKYGEYDVTVVVWRSYYGGLMQGELDRWGWKNNKIEIGNQLYGYVKDKWGNPVEGLQVRATWGLWDSRTDYTNSNGIYKFSGLPTDKTVSVEARLTDGEYIEILDASNGNKMIYKKIVTSNIPSTSWKKLPDIMFDSGHEDEGAVIFSYTREAVNFYINNLKIKLDKSLPEKIEIFSNEGTAHRRSLLGCWITIQDDDSGTGDKDAPENREWHEFSHHVMYDLFNSWPPMHGTWNSGTERYEVADLNGDGDFNDKGEYDRNHGGYNSHCTSDSWAEGFAEFMSCVISAERGDDDADKYDWAGGPSSFERQWQDWEDEEFAIASILWDLYDDSTTKDHPWGSDGIDDDNVDLTIKQIFNVIGVKHYLPVYYDSQGVWIGNQGKKEYRYIYYLKDLYDVFIDFAKLNDINKDGQIDNKDINDIKNIFANHNVPRGLTDNNRPNRR